MKFIENLIDIDLKVRPTKRMFINTLNGLCDIVNQREYEVICQWRESGINQNIRNKDLLEFLIKRGYVVEEDYDEGKVRNELVSRLKKQSDKLIEDCNNVAFILTYACNFQCPYCYESDIQNSRSMSFDQIENIFSIHNGKIGRVGLFGGEPLLMGNREKIKYIIKKAPDAPFSVITNGYHLEEYYEVLKNQDIASIQVTIDGEEEVHNRTRIHKQYGDTFKKIMQGVELFAKNGFPLILRMNVSAENYKSCLAVKHEIEREPWSKNITFDIQWLFQVDSEIKESLRQEMLLADGQRIEEKRALAKRQGVISDFLYNGKPLHPIVKMCNLDYKYRFYDPNGDIYSCILAVGNPAKRIGTYEPNLIWEEKSMLKRDITTVPKCQKCKYALVCGAGCPNAIPESCDVMITPNCISMMDEIENVIPTLYKLRRGLNERDNFIG